MLEHLKAQHALLRVHFPTVSFQSLLRLVDAKAGRILLERSAVEAANEALVARPRCTFHCEHAGWHLEFVASAPYSVVHHGRPAIQCRFPDVLVSHQRRAHERVSVRPPLPLRVVADAGGIMPFEARIIDIALGGMGFLVYSSSITLEPGTLLRGCRFEVPGGGACVADLEVRYSQAVTFANGRRAVRSGCRFVSASPELVRFAKRYVKNSGSG